MKFIYAKNITLYLPLDSIYSLELCDDIDFEELCTGSRRTVYIYPAGFSQSSALLEWRSNKYKVFLLLFRFIDAARLN